MDSQFVKAWKVLSTCVDNPFTLFKGAIEKRPRIGIISCNRVDEMDSATATKDLDEICALAIAKPRSSFGINGDWAMALCEFCYYLVKSFIALNKFWKSSTWMQQRM
jgi:hypothetical protein